MIERQLDNVWTLAATAGATSATTVNNLAYGSYRFRVKACFTGDECGLFSSASNLVTLEEPQPPQPTFRPIYNALNVLCLDVQGYDGNQRDNVMMWNCQSHSDQRWLLPAVGEWGVIRNEKRSLCLDVAGYNGAERDNVMLYACDGFDDQQWMLEGSGIIRNKAQGLCLDVAGYDGAKGKNVMLYRCDGYADQNWYQ
jgi:hypothetical protein